MIFKGFLAISLGVVLLLFVQFIIRRIK